METKISLPLEKENEFLTINVRHNAGGINYFNYKSEERGVYIHFQKEIITKGNGYSCSEFCPCDASSFKIKAVEYKRKSQKKINDVFEWTKEYKDVILNMWKQERYQEISVLIKRVYGA